MVELPSITIIITMGNLMVISTWSNKVTEILEDIWGRILNFLPDLIGAIVILVIGWIVAELVAWAVDRFLRLLRLPDVFQTAKVEELFKKAGSHLDTTGLISAAVKWVLLLVSFIAAADILGLDTIQEFLNSVLGYLDNVVAAGAILLIGAIFAHFMASVIKGAISVAKLSFAEMVSNVVKYAILVFAFLAALDQLGIADQFIGALFYGFVGLVAIAGGLAFGLGGQNVAKEWMEKIKKEMQG